MMNTCLLLAGPVRKSQVDWWWIPVFCQQDPSRSLQRFFYFCLSFNGPNFPIFRGHEFRRGDCTQSQSHRLRTARRHLTTNILRRNGFYNQASWFCSRTIHMSPLLGEDQRRRLVSYEKTRPGCMRQQQQLECEPQPDISNTARPSSQYCNCTKYDKTQ